MSDWPKRAYELAYRFATKGKGAVPAAVLVTIAPKDMTAFEEMLSAELAFVADPKFCRGVQFGFGSCASETETAEGKVFELRFNGPDDLEDLTRTSHLLFEMLHSFYLRQDLRPGSNNEQLVEIMPWYRGGEKPYPIDGSISHTLVTWLAERLERSGHKTSGFAPAINVPEIMKAMRDAFFALAPKDMRLLARDCGMGIMERGRPQMNAFGAVSGVIPRDYWEPETQVPSGVSSDNVDGPLQQMVHLAGWAALYQLAAKELG